MQPQNPQEPQTPTPPQDPNVQQAPQPQAVPPQPIQPQAPTTATPTPPQPATYSAPVAAKKGFPKWIIIVGVIVLVFIVLIVVAALAATTATKAPQKISDQFMNQLQSGDTGAAYALTSKTFKEATTEVQLTQIVKQVSPHVQGEEKVTKRAIHKSTGVPQTAVLVYEVKTSEGTRYVKVELQKDGDSWQVINFRADEKPLDTEVE